MLALGWRLRGLVGFFWGGQLLWVLWGSGGEGGWGVLEGGWLDFDVQSRKL